MAAYAVKAHTRATSATFFTHVLGLFDPDSGSSTILGLRNKLHKNAIATLLDFMNIPPKDFQGFEYVTYITENDTQVKTVVGLTRAEVRIAKNIQNWINYETSSHPGIYMETLTM